jgi:membrane protein YdbS with pleckstrin-like domain
MLTENEKQFVKYWEENRLKEKNWKYQLLTGLPWGLLFSMPILVLVMTAKFWYKRADMEANTMVNPVILVIAVLLIATFVAFFYKSHRWEMKDQLYQSLKAREKQENTPQTSS